MTHPHFYASTSRNLDRVLQYGVYPLGYMVGLLASRDNAKATQWARLSGAACSSLLTTAFLGLETHALDTIVRDAVTAEMGVDADKYKPSDCRYSKNVIAQEGYTDLMGLQPKRYLKDALYLLPSLIEFVYSMTGKGVVGVDGKRRMPISKDIRSSFDPRNAKAFDNKKFGTWDIIANGHPGWDMSIYMATSAYWGYETFIINKNGYYPIAQDIVGKIKPTDGDISINHLLDVYQRTRSDQKIPMLESNDGASHTEVRKLLQRMVDAYNKHDGSFDVPEIVYLIGLNKINVHATDHKTISQEAIDQSNKEIDKVLSVGLDGIREENKKIRLQAAQAGSESIAAASGNIRESSRKPSFVPKAPSEIRRTFVDRVTDGAIRATQNAIGSIGLIPKRPEGYLSTADPTELIGSDSSLWR